MRSHIYKKLSLVVSGIALLIGDPRYLRFNVLIREDAEGLPFANVNAKTVLFAQLCKDLNCRSDQAGKPCHQFGRQNKIGDHNATHAVKAFGGNIICDM